MRDTLLYGLKGQDLLHISLVKNGKKCGCKCPACGEDLIARNKGTKINKYGQLRLRTFAHFDPKKVCSLYFETTLHYLAKNIFSENSKILLPEIKATIKHYNSDNFEQITVMPSKNYTYNKVNLEQTINNIKPDVTIQLGYTKLFIEIKVTHGIDEIKLAKIKSLNLSVIEIDLSKFDRNNIDLTFLRQHILNSIKQTKWINNSKQTKLDNQYQTIEDKYLKTFYKNVVVREFQKPEEWGYETLYYNHIDDCSLEKRKFKDKYYASVERDCTKCKYFKGYRQNKTKAICSAE